MVDSKHELKISTKECPKCGSRVLREFRSLNKKVCHDCKAEIPWYLEVGQTSLIKYTR